VQTPEPIRFELELSRCRDALGRHVRILPYWSTTSPTGT
jgi:hypothetical protein